MENFRLNGFLRYVLQNTTLPSEPGTLWRNGAPQLTATSASYKQQPATRPHSLQLAHKG